MALTPPTPGLRTLFNKSNGPAKLQITVAPGGSITVPDDVAAQIALARAPMADVTDGDAPAAASEPVTEVDAKPAKPKSAAKKS